MFCRAQVLIGGISTAAGCIDGAVVNNPTVLEAAVLRGKRDADADKRWWSQALDRCLLRQVEAMEEVAQRGEGKTSRTPCLPTLLVHVLVHQNCPSKPFDCCRRMNQRSLLYRGMGRHELRTRTMWKLAIPSSTKSSTSKIKIMFQAGYAKQARVATAPIYTAVLLGLRREWSKRTAWWGQSLLACHC